VSVRGFGDGVAMSGLGCPILNSGGDEEEDEEEFEVYSLSDVWRCSAERTRFNAVSTSREGLRCSFITHQVDLTTGDDHIRKFWDNLQVRNLATARIFVVAFVRRRRTKCGYHHPK